MALRRDDITWTDDLIARLRDLHEGDRLSFSAIAKRLSEEFKVVITKNAVIGKAHRLGLEKRQSYTPSRKRKAAPEPKPLVEPGPPEPVTRVLPWRVPKIITKAPPRGDITIWQLKRGVCHFPLGARYAPPPYAYCGLATGDPAQSYCPDHYKRTHYLPHR